MEVISLLLDEQQYLSPDSKAYAQFWHLYRTALIGIESLEVAKAMINFGKVLETLGESRSKPTGDFRNLAAAVLDQMSKEVEELKPTADKIMKRPPSTQ